MENEKSILQKIKELLGITSKKLNNTDEPNTKNEIQTENISTSEKPLPVIKNVPDKPEIQTENISTSEKPLPVIKNVPDKPEILSELEEINKNDENNNPTLQSPSYQKNYTMEKNLKQNEFVIINDWENMNIDQKERQNQNFEFANWRKK